MTKIGHQISHKEYQQKRFEAAKDLLCSAINQVEKFNAIGEDKQLQSLVSNCIFLADTLISELGFVKSDPETSSVRSLKSILEADQDE